MLWAWSTCDASKGRLALPDETFCGTTDDCCKDEEKPAAGPRSIQLSSET